MALLSLFGLSFFFFFTVLRAPMDMFDHSLRYSQTIIVTSTTLYICWCQLAKFASVNVNGILSISFWLCGESILPADGFLSILFCLFIHQIRVWYRTQGCKKNTTCTMQYTNHVIQANYISADRLEQPVLQPSGQSGHSTFCILRNYDSPRQVRATIVTKGEFQDLLERTLCN